MSHLIKVSLLDIIGSKVSIEVVENNLRPDIPAKTPDAYAKLMRKCWVS